MNDQERSGTRDERRDERLDFRDRLRMELQKNGGRHPRDLAKLFKCSASKVTQSAHFWKTYFRTVRESPRLAAVGWVELHPDLERSA